LEDEAKGDAEEVEANGEAEDENALNVDCFFAAGAGAGTTAGAGFSASGGGYSSVLIHHDNDEGSWEVYNARKRPRMIE